MGIKCSHVGNNLFYGSNLTPRPPCQDPAPKRGGEPKEPPILRGCGGTVARWCENSIMIQHLSGTAGAYTTTFTASQGLLLMIPNMYKLAGEQTPTVFHVAARALATHALSIFGDHSDVMSCRQTGFAMLCSNNVQQVMDLGAVAHLATIAGKLPMMHFFDGFRTSHEYQKIEVWDYEDLREMVDWDAVKRFRERALNPEHPHLLGSAEQPETFFQHREACNTAYLETVETIAKYMDMVNSKIGTDYKPFNYYGAADATEILVAMGSVCDAAEEVKDCVQE